MAFINVTKARGKGKLTVNTDYVKLIKPVSSTDNRAVIVFAANASGDEEKVNVLEDFDALRNSL